MATLLVPLTLLHTCDWVDEDGTACARASHWQATFVKSLYCHKHHKAMMNVGWEASEFVRLLWNGDLT